METDFNSVVLPDLIKQVETFQDRKNYKSTNKVVGLDGAIYYLSIFDDSLINTDYSQNCYVSPEDALEYQELYGGAQRPGRIAPHAVYLGASEQAKYEADGLHKQFDYYGLAGLKTKTVVHPLSDHNDKVVLITPFLGKSLLDQMQDENPDSALEQEPDRPKFTLAQINALWAMLRHLELDHGDIVEQNIIIHYGFPILIDRTRNPFWVEDTQNPNYSFDDVKTRMAEQLSFIAQRFDIDPQLLDVDLRPKSI